MNWINQIDELLLKEAKRDTIHHHPTSARVEIDGKVSGKCMRAQWYAWTKEPTTNPFVAGDLWRMKSGDAMHTLISGWLRELGLGVTSEKSCRIKVDGLEHEVSGRMDNVLEAEHTGIEVKSSFGRGMTAEDGIINAGPKIEWLMQCAVYRHISDIKTWYILCVARDNGYRCQFELDKQQLDSLWPKIVESWKKLEGYLTRKELPPRDYEVIIKDGVVRSKVQVKGIKLKSDWQCAYGEGEDLHKCQWCDLCWKGEKDNYLEKGGA